MSDLVERLREFEGRPDQNEYALISEAADEIERLRALLAQYQVANYAPEDSDLYEETRRELEGK